MTSLEITDFDYWLLVWHIIVSVSPYHADHLMTSPSWCNHFEAHAIKAMNQSIGHTSKFIPHSSHVHIFGDQNLRALLSSWVIGLCLVGRPAAYHHFQSVRSVSCIRWDQNVDRISRICPKLPTQSSLATMFSKLTAFETCKWRGETLVRCGRFSQFSQVRVSKRWSCDLIRFRCCWPTRWLPQGIQFW